VPEILPGPGTEAHLVRRLQEELPIKVLVRVPSTGVVQVFYSAEDRDQVPHSAVDRVARDWAPVAMAVETFDVSELLRCRALTFEGKASRARALRFALTMVALVALFWWLLGGVR